MGTDVLHEKTSLICCNRFLESLCWQDVIWLAGFLRCVYEKIMV